MLLEIAAELEHALLIEYLYAAFVVRRSLYAIPSSSSRGRRWSI